MLPAKEDKHAQKGGVVTVAWVPSEGRLTGEQGTESSQ